MIPKIIHYCWFGRNPLPRSAVKCINSWKKFFPEYEIKEWNEDNFDVNVIPYTAQAYSAKKYAFVSDYARFWILYHYGGVYFDTDVKVLKTMDDILNRGSFMGREAGSRIIMDGGRCALAVAPGLGMGMVPHHKILKELLDTYSGLRFLLEDGKMNIKTIVSYTTDVLVRHGLTANNDEIEEVDGIFIYPPDYLCPMDHTRGCLVTLTDRTVSIHLYDSSWNDHSTLRYKLHQLKNLLMRVFGPEKIEKIISLFNKI